MMDYFALLGEPRRPWLDPEALMTKFLTLSTAVHPDRVHNAPPAEKDAATRRYAELNAAHTCLRDPKARLLHLLELEMGHRPPGIEQAPADAMEFFMQVSQLCREVDQFQSERGSITSPILKVKSFEQGLALTERIMQLQATLRERLAKLEAELQSLNAGWKTAPVVGSDERAGRLPLARLEHVCRSLSFTTRWISQLQERLVQLSL